MRLNVGDRIWGEAGIKCEVLGFAGFENSIQIKIRCPGGDRLISPEQIKGIESPIQPGDRVRLKNTDRHYVVTRIYPVRAGKDPAGEWITEAYCSLTTEAGTPATWKLIQLEKMTHE